jgi:hypothetical protein
MSQPSQPTGAVLSSYAPVGGTMIVPPQPDELVFPLRREQFDLLCEGEVSEQRTLRDICIATCASAAVGLMGLLATIDWDFTVRQGRKGPFIWTSILAVIMLASAVTLVVAQHHITRTGKRSGYSRVKQRISDFFNI